VFLGDSSRLLSRQTVPSKASVVFLDPPYGDSVPYLEFSSMWNSFLGDTPDPGDDISVSDRSGGDGSWHRYEKGLRGIMSALGPVMGDDCRIIVTFNNKDLRAWRALLGALQSAGLRCDGAFYQHPAVVSAKAQLARDGSYVGDVYCVFVRAAQQPGLDPSPASDAVVRVLRAHPELAPDDEALKRVAVLELLRSNIDVGVFEHLPGLIEKARSLALASPEPQQASETFASLAVEVAGEMLQRRERIALGAVAAELHTRAAHLGVLSMPRLEALLGQHFNVVDGEIARSAKQLALF
jgi:hypothetical protein